ncbi:hypothetical protein [Legionella nagasakiensis]|uniref:hypothetical protein n=1 Tax=Legionella nagasakiensis TaxID=535290 RepID=UPI00105637EE|nr:hypothetical protein [Legionella nagasakiensis]
MNKTISVYFSGTGFSIDDDRFLAASLLDRTEESESQIKMGFNGCGVDYGFNGTIFGSGLDEQCEKVIDRIIQEINAGHQITLNVYGHSRGGIAALLLAKQLGNIDQDKLAINLALLDPVPGNFITTSNIDPFKISLANKTMDLSDCKPLRKVLALYPHIPLPAIACHAPLLVSYPQETEVEEEVVNGCHAQAEQIFHPSSKLVKLRVEEFLVKNGTQLQTNRDYNDTEAMKQVYLSRYQEELAYVEQTVSREAHSARGMVITAAPGAKYLNNRHKALVGDSSQEPVCLSIQSEKGLFSGCRIFFTNYPLVGQVFKWTLFALSVAALLYFTGGLAAIPLLAPVVAKIGALSLLAFSPVIGSTLAALWYGAVKPILSWCASKFFYPHYATRKTEAPKAEIPDSTKGLMDALGVDRSSEANSHTVGSAPYQGKSPLHSAKKVVKEELQHGNEQEGSLSFS